MKIPGEKKEVVVRTVYKLAGVKCDVCGRVIDSPTKENRYHRMDDDHKYYSVTTGHNDWGNDSCESIEHYDVCPDCINKFVAEYLGDKKGYRSAYIEIQTKHVYYDYEMDEED